MQHTPRLNRPSLLSMQHNYESQDGDGTRSPEREEQGSVLPTMRRVQSYSGTEEGRGGMAEGGSWNQEQGQGQGSAFTPDDVTTAPRSASMHPVPSYGVVPTTEGSGARSDVALISPTTFAVFGKDSRKSMEGSTTTSASTTGLVGPSIPFALRRASSDCQFTSTGSLSRGGVEHEGKQPWAKAGIFGGGFSSTTENSGSSTTGWSDPPTTTATSGGFGKQPSTPPKETANPVAVPTAIDVSNMSFNPGSPSNTNGQGSSTMMSTTPVRSSLGMGLRARANSGTRLRGSGAAFGNQTRHPPLPPSLRATLAADKDLPSSEIRSEALLQRVIFSNPDSLPMTPRPSRRHQQQIYSQFGTTVAAGGAAGNGTANGGLFGGNLNNSIYSGNGYAGRTTARPPRFLDSAASTIDSDDEDEMEDSSDEEAQFAVDDIMDLGGTGTGTGTGMGTGAGSRSGSGSGSASGSVMLGVAAASGATTSAGTEGGMEVDAPMTTSSNAPMGTGQGKLSNRTSMGSLRGFAGVDSEDSAGSGQASNKNMTAWRESPSSTSNRAQKRKAVHEDSRYEPYGKRHRTAGAEGPLSPLQWSSTLPGASVPPIPISPSNQYTAHHNPHFPTMPAGLTASSTATGNAEGAIMQMESGSGPAMNKYGYPLARSRAGSPVANTYAAMRTAVSPVASSPLSMMSGMGIGANNVHSQAAYRPHSATAAGGTTIGMGGMGGLGMLLLSKRHATNPGGTGMGLVSMGDDSGEMEVAEGINGMDVTEHAGAERNTSGGTRDDEDDKMMFD